MQIRGYGPSPGDMGGALRIRAVGAQTGSTGGAPGTGSLRGFAQDVRELGEALRNLRLDGRFRTTGRAKDAVAISDGDIGLQVTSGPASLSSTEEVNTIATSFGPYEPEWQGNSNSDPTFSGVYDGSQGDDTLTFTVVQEGRIGDDVIELEITDGSGALVETLTLGRTARDEPQLLSNGLVVTFDGGRMRADDSFELDVFASIGTAVNPDGRMDRPAPDGAGFDPGVVVNDGQFYINGERIRVRDRDSINDVLADINDSDAGVSAVFDETTERIILTNSDPQNTDPIELTGDTSGFLDAVKLSGAVMESGERDELEVRFEDVAALSGVSNGAFTINGVEFTVDRETDSLASVIRQVNASEAGVFMHYYENTGQVKIRGFGGKSVVLDGGTSGLFDAIQIDDGTYRGEKGAREVNFRDRRALQESLREFAGAYSEVFERAVSGSGVGTADVVRRALTEEFEQAFDEILGRDGSQELRSQLGLDLSRREEGLRSLEVDSVDLVRAVKRRSKDLSELLFGDRSPNGREGLVERLEGALEKAYEQLASQLSPEESVGLRLDLRG